MQTRSVFKRFGVLLLAAAALVAHPAGARAFQFVSAEQGNQLILSGDAVLLDVRTVQEARVVGSPAAVPGGEPLGYLIPYELRLGRNAAVENPFFAGAVEQALGDAKDEPVIIICHTGRRATAAAAELEALGFTQVLVMDDPVNPGNTGGFGGAYATSYRGWPVLLPGGDPGAEGVTWLGSGLPVTNSVDPSRIFAFPAPGGFQGFRLGADGRPQ